MYKITIGIHHFVKKALDLLQSFLNLIIVPEKLSNYFTFTAHYFSLL
jgi:hypothetical protein